MTGTSWSVDPAVVVRHGVVVNRVNGDKDGCRVGVAIAVVDGVAE